MAQHKAPGRYHHGDLERAMIEEAIVLTEEHGMEAWSFAEIARRLGVSSGAPYKHFKNKTELLDAVARFGLTQVRDSIQSALALSREPREQLVELVRGVVRLAHRQPTLYRLTFAGVRTDTLAKLAAADESTAFGLLRKAVVGWVECGLFAPADPNELSIVLWAHGHGLASLVASRRLELSERRAMKLAGEHVAALLCGIGRSSAAAAARAGRVRA